MTGLQADNLTVTRGGLPVLSGVTFTLEPGRALILRAPNGAGKTTLLRTLAGLQPAAKGEIIGDPSHIAYAAHADGVKLMLTVAENLRVWGDLFAAGAIDAALDTFDLRGLADRLAGNLSAGQKRRLGLARLMVIGRPIWALDEPTVSLDTRAVGLFRNAVQAHLEQGGSALIATHIDLGLEAAQVLDLTPFRAVPDLQEVYF